MNQNKIPRLRGRLAYSLLTVMVTASILLGACTTPQPTPTPSAVPPTETALPPTEPPAPTPTGTATPAPDFSAEPIVNKVWQWLRTDFSDGATTAVDDPSKYVIEFKPDGLVQGVADCNSMGGTYQVSGSSLTIQVTQLTLMACPEGSMADEFVQRLGEVATYVIQNGVLFLNLKLDSGNMVFGQEPVAILPAPQEGQPSARSNAYLNVRSGPGTNYVVYGVMPPGRTALVVGKSQDSQWLALSVPVAPLQQGWVSVDFVTASGVENVPVLPAPPVPPSTSMPAPGETDPQLTALEPTYVRSGPGESYPAYGVAPDGAVAGVIGRSQDGLWWVVRLDPNLVPVGNGWVSIYYTSPKNIPVDLPVVAAPQLAETVAPPVPPAGAASGVTLTAVNVRSGPGTTYPVLAVAPAGTVVEITGKSQDAAWWQIRVPNNVSADGLAWLSVDYVYASNTDNVPVAAPGSGGSGAPAPTLAPGGTPLPPGSGGSVKIGTTTEPVNVYKKADKNSGTYGAFGKGTTGVIVGQSADGKWVAFALPTSVSADGKGWVIATYVIIQTVNSATATALATANPPPVVATPEGTPGSSSQCKIVSVAPAAGAIFALKAEFDMVVKIKNTSGSTWDPATISVKFQSAINGVEIHTSPSTFALPSAVLANDQITIYVDMAAPNSAGSFGETWGLVQGGNAFCQWAVSIVVQ